jgi:hypothetical protein
MSTPIDDEEFPEEHVRTHEEVKQGNPGRPQSDFENPPDGPSDEPADGADRADGQYVARTLPMPSDRPAGNGPSNPAGAG